MIKWWSQSTLVSIFPFRLNEKIILSSTRCPWGYEERIILVFLRRIWIIYFNFLFTYFLIIFSHCNHFFFPLLYTVRFNCMFCKFTESAAKWSHLFLFGLLVETSKQQQNQTHTHTREKKNTKTNSVTESYRRKKIVRCQSRYFNWEEAVFLIHLLSWICYAVMSFVVI